MGPHPVVTESNQNTSSSSPSPPLRVMSCFAKVKEEVPDRTEVVDDNRAGILQPALPSPVALESNDDRGGGSFDPGNSLKRKRMKYDLLPGVLDTLRPEDNEEEEEEGEDGHKCDVRPETEPGLLDLLPPATYGEHNIVVAAVPSASAPPLPPPLIPQTQSLVAVQSFGSVAVVNKVCKQFWKAGDYKGRMMDDEFSVSIGMDHLRVHPKFLHSNATSHKWALGALVELLDNSVDEVCSGATFVNIDMIVSKKDGSRMLLVQDDGGGMTPDRMRQYMSLGYSAKSKSANTIGQYGNGFKTSTMRLGADVIVFSRSCGKYGARCTQSIGLLSYTFLRTTGKEDIVVPIIDYEKIGNKWERLTRLAPAAWDNNLKTMIQWSPYISEFDLLEQFSSISGQGTRIIIYNLWEDDQGELELDFDSDNHDIQLRGVNRDEKKIEMAKTFPNSRHFLTFQHSLKSYASILYLRLPPEFKMVLRGIEIEHHSIIEDMMLNEKVTYRPLNSNVSIDVNIGFVKDARHHIDVQGFNVYHKNRLIKPFWRVWNPPGSDGRGIIGVLEANFVEPAHDKQGFERTEVLKRLEDKLKTTQRDYWRNKCHEIGYAPRQKLQETNYVPKRRTICHNAIDHRDPAPTSSENDTIATDKLPDVIKLNNFREPQSTENLYLCLYQNTRATSSQNVGSITTASPKCYAAEQVSSIAQSEATDLEMFNSTEGSYEIPNSAMDCSDDNNERVPFRGFIVRGPSFDWSRLKPLQEKPNSSILLAPRITITPRIQERFAPNANAKSQMERRLRGKMTDEQIEHLIRENEALKNKVKEVEELLETAEKEKEALIRLITEERTRQKEVRKEG